MKIQLDMYQTLTMAVLVLLLGKYLRKKFYILQKFCIPAPVIGGLLFAIMTCLCYVTGIAELLLMTRCVKSAWYFSLPLSDFRPT